MGAGVPEMTSPCADPLPTFTKPRGHQVSRVSALVDGLAERLEMMERRPVDYAM